MVEVIRLPDAEREIKLGKESIEVQIPVPVPTWIPVVNVASDLMPNITVPLRVAKTLETYLWEVEGPAHFDSGKSSTIAEPNITIENTPGTIKLKLSGRDEGKLFAIEIDCIIRNALGIVPLPFGFGGEEGVGGKMLNLAYKTADNFNNSYVAINKTGVPLLGGEWVAISKVLTPYRGEKLLTAYKLVAGGDNGVQNYNDLLIGVAKPLPSEGSIIAADRPFQVLISANKVTTIVSIENFSEPPEPGDMVFIGPDNQITTDNYGTPIGVITEVSEEDEGVYYLIKDDFYKESTDETGTYITISDKKYYTQDSKVTYNDTQYIGSFKGTSYKVTYQTIVTKQDFTGITSSVAIQITDIPGIDVSSKLRGGGILPKTMYLSDNRGVLFSISKEAVRKTYIYHGERNSPTFPIMVELVRDDTIEGGDDGSGGAFCKIVNGVNGYGTFVATQFKGQLQVNNADGSEFKLIPLQAPNPVVTKIRAVYENGAPANHLIIAQNYDAGSPNIFNYCGVRYSVGPWVAGPWNFIDAGLGTTIVDYDLTLYSSPIPILTLLINAAVGLSVSSAPHPSRDYLGLQGVGITHLNASVFLISAYTLGPTANTEIVLLKYVQANNTLTSLGKIALVNSKESLKGRAPLRPIRLTNTRIALPVVSENGIVTTLLVTLPLTSQDLIYATEYSFPTFIPASVVEQEFSIDVVQQDSKLLFFARGVDAFLDVPRAQWGIQL